MSQKSKSQDDGRNTIGKGRMYQKSKSQEDGRNIIGKGRTSQKSKNQSETEIQQNICESKGFIKDEQQWFITGSLHKPTEFTSEEDRKKFESQVKSLPGVEEPDGVRPSILTSLKWQLVTLKTEINIVFNTLAYCDCDPVFDPVTQLSNCLKREKSFLGSRRKNGIFGVVVCAYSTGSF